MAKTLSTLIVAAALAALLGACAPSPLHVGGKRVGTGGEIPRDGRGEPIWAEIRPSPPDVPRHLPVPVMPAPR